jgi:hypothetical protein
MSFSEIKAGGWVTGEKLLPEHANQINGDLPFALDGRDGGAYEPTAPLVIGGAYGYIRTGMRIAVGNGTTGAHTYSAVNYQHVFIPATGTVSSGCIWQIDDTGAFDGEWLRFVNLANSNSIVVKDPGGATLSTIQASSISACTVARLSGVWAVIDLSRIV